MSRTLVEKRDVRPEELVEVGPRVAARSRRRGVGVIRQVPGAGPLPDPRPERRRGRPRRPDPRLEGEGGRTPAQVPELAGDAAVRQEPDAVPHRQGQGPDPQGGQAVIVEGYTDALMAHQAGFDNVVASLGTALTPGQVALLTRYAKQIALAYDVDAAGEKAGTFGVQALAGPHRPARGDRDRRRARRGPGRPAARRQGSRRGRPRVARSLARGGPHRPADRRVPRRHVREDATTSRRRAARRASSRRVMPTIREVPNPVMRDRLPAARPPRLGRGGARCCLRGRSRRPASRIRSAGPGRRGGDGAQGGGAVHRRRGHRVADVAARQRDPPRRAAPARRSSCGCSCSCRSSAAPGRRRDRAGPAAEHRRPRAVPRDRARPRARTTQGVHPPFSRTALIQALDRRPRRSPRRCMRRRGPNPRDPREARSRLRGRAPDSSISRSDRLRRARRLHRGGPGARPNEAGDRRRRSAALMLEATTDQRSSAGRSTAVATRPGCCAGPPEVTAMPLIRSTSSSSKPS